MGFDIALSGIQAVNEQLNTTSNNIANANTYGFKSSRANFSSLYAGDQANGVEVGSLTQSIDVNGSVQTTGRSLDAAIAGRGFFVIRDQAGSMQYTRLGVFNVDKEGYVVDTKGNKVQGYGPTNGGALGVLGDLKVPSGQIAAAASTRVQFVGNLSADWPVPAPAFNSDDSTSYNMVKQSVLYDSLGTQHTVSQYFVKSATNNQVQVYYAFDGAAIDTSAPSATLTFDANGALATAAQPALTMTPINGAAPLTFTVDYLGSTQFAGDATTTTNSSDGYASGTFVGVDIQEDGSVVAKYSNEQQQTIGTIALATFPDEGALNSLSGTSWAATAASGTALYGVPGIGLAGKLATGALESSNVDVTAELVGLMTSQRNYQANSKVIASQSQMMQALMQAM